MNGPVARPAPELIENRSIGAGRTGCQPDAAGVLAVVKRSVEGSPLGADAQAGPRKSAESETASSVLRKGRHLGKTVEDGWDAEIGAART